jgi:hypothetical protein
MQPKIGETEVKLGDESADYLGPGGYRYIDIDGKTYRADKIAWFFVHGKWPTDVEHLDGDLTNNQLKNLRPIGPFKKIVEPEAIHLGLASQC